MKYLEMINEFLVSSLDSWTDVEIDPDLDLFDSGILDSFRLMELVVWLEEKFSVTVHDEMMTVENLSTMNRIAAFLEEMHTCI